MWPGGSAASLQACPSRHERIECYIQIGAESLVERTPIPVVRGAPAPSAINRA